MAIAVARGSQAAADGGCVQKFRVIFWEHLAHFCCFAKQTAGACRVSKLFFAAYLYTRWYPEEKVSSKLMWKLLVHGS